MSSENKVIKDDNHVILILIYDIFAEKLMDFETELSNEIGFIKVDNSGIEAGDRNILDEHGFLHWCLSLELIMPRAWTIFTRVPKMTIIEIDEIRGEQIGIEKIWNEFGLSGLYCILILLFTLC